MPDSRNVAHDKTVQLEKKHRGEAIAPGADVKPQPGKKPHMEHHASDAAKTTDGSSDDDKGAGDDKVASDDKSKS